MKKLPFILTTTLLLTLSATCVAMGGQFRGDSSTMTNQDKSTHQQKTFAEHSVNQAMHEAKTLSFVLGDLGSFKAQFVKQDLAVLASFAKHKETFDIENRILQAKKLLPMCDLFDKTNMQAQLDNEKQIIAMRMADTFVEIDKLMKEREVQRFNQLLTKLSDKGQKALRQQVLHSVSNSSSSTQVNWRQFAESDTAQFIQMFSHMCADRKHIEQLANAKPADFKVKNKTDSFKTASGDEIGVVETHYEYQSDKGEDK